MTDIREDKAEVYSHLIMNYCILQERAKTDRVLASKIKRMKEMLQKFSPHFNTDFWLRVEERVRSSTQSASNNEAAIPMDQK